MFYLLSFFILLSSCTSLQTHSLLVKFNQAVSENQKGQNEKAKELWTQLCAKKHKASCLLAGEKTSWYPGLSIMQGASDETSAQFSILYKKSDAQKIFVFSQKTSKMVEPSQREDQTRSHSLWVVSTVVFKNLKKDEEYTLVAMNESGELIDFRNFKTLETQKKNFRWAVASCMSDHFKDIQETQWKDLESFKTDAIFMIGDNVYVDWNRVPSTPKRLWNRYVETRNTLAIFRQASLTPVYATWDDHDYGDNDGDRTFRYKSEAQKVFHSFFPMNKNHSVIARGPGVSSAVSLSGQLFIFMDDRSFRTPKKMEKVQSHFGEKQTQWALDLIKKSNKPIWLISGDQFFGGYHPFESHQGSHPQDFKNFLSEIRKTKKKVLFMSGDRHLSEIMEIPKKYLGYKTYEVTSSGIHSTTHAGALKKAPNPLGVEGVDGIVNYMILEKQEAQKSLKVKVQDYGPGKKLLFERDLQVRY